jgi:hypothetical protein
VRAASVGLGVAAWSVAAIAVAAQSTAPAVDMAGLLARVGEQVQEYFARAQSVICKETLRVQSLGSDLLGDGSHARHVVFDLRVAWEPGSDANDAPRASVLREVVSVNGRPPRDNDQLACLDPDPVSPEPLTMFLPNRQRDSAFKWAGLGRVDGRAAVMVDYQSLESGPITVARKQDCVSFELPGRNRGRVWLDQATGEVLRIDERLTGMFDLDVPADPSRHLPTALWMLERADVTIRYKRVTFRDPEETLLLPASIESLTVVRTPGIRVRRTQVFSDYRRFMTEGRIIQ